MASVEYQGRTIKIGDTLTFEGVYEPESLWDALVRRLGRRPPRKLRKHVVTYVSRDLTFYQPLP